MKRILLTCFVLFLAILSTEVMGQQRVVSGKVTGSDDGLPLPGVTILIKGTTTGASTDADGNYSLRVPSSEAVLIFRYLGYVAQEITVGNQGVVNVIMQPEAVDVGEVVVVAYGTEKQANVSSAVSVVKAENINQVPLPSLDQVLQGQAAGLNIQTSSGQPGASATILLRGRGSINGNQEPLFVIDGVPVDEDDFRALNPNDVENVSVLKDASASALYGNRGANGAIIITTKRAKLNSGVRINFSAQVGQTDQIDPNFTMMNSQQLLETQRDLGTGLGNGLTDQEIADLAATNTNWKDIFFRTGYTQDYQLNISSGTETTTSYTSFGYFEQEGTVESSDLKRYNFRNNTTTNFNDRLQLTTNLTVNFAQQNTAPNEGTGQLDNPFINPYIALPFIDAFNEDGSLNIEGTPYSTQNGANINGFLNTPFITLNTSLLNTRYNEQVRGLGNIDLNYEIADGLVAGVNGGLDFAQTEGLFITTPESIRGDITPDVNASQKGSQTNNNQRDRTLNSRVYLLWNKRLNGKHNIDVQLSTEYYNRKQTTFGQTGFGLDPKLVGSGNAFTDGTTEENGALYYVPTVGTSEVEIATFSYFGVAKYNYDEIWGGQLSARRDASSRFSTTNRWGTFWSAAAYYNLDRTVLADAAWVDALKVRVSYGTSGNERISGGVFGSANAALDLYARGIGYNNQPSYVPAQIGNRELSWERLTKFNIGADFSFFNGVLSGALEVYNNKTTDAFLPRPISLTSGFTTINANIGELRNRGVELTLNYQIFNNSDWRVSVGGNIAYNENEVLKLADSDSIEGFNSITAVGQALGTFYVVRYAGVNPANGDPLYLDQEGNITDEYNLSNRVITDKNRDPRFVGGFNTNISYKGFTFTTQWSYAVDQWRNNGSFGVVADVGLIGFANQSTVLLDAWQNPGDRASFPRLTRAGLRQEASDLFLEDASFLRLRNATLAYNFPRELLAKQRAFRTARVFFQAQNLLTFSKWRGFDPESNLAGTFFEYPTSRIWTVGINVGF
jgi:TonB-linked SusC/RagA family outer membrane protein